MDTDLQDPVEVIHEMVRKWEQGADVVYALPGHQYERSTQQPGSFLSSGKERSLFKTYSSEFYQSIISRFQEPGQTYVSTDFRLFDREVAEVIRKLPERNIYLRNVFAWLCPLSEDTDLHTSSPVSGCFRSVCIPYRMGRRRKHPLCPIMDVIAGRAIFVKKLYEVLYGRAAYSTRKATLAEWSDDEILL